MNDLSKTKEKIFDTFIEMASSLGYENVTIREISTKVGINAASIYYHYESKEKILEHVYEYYGTHYFDTRLPVEEMKKLIETASAEDFIFAMCRNYVSDDPKKHIRMILITKIVYMRLYQDTYASSMFLRHNADDYRYVAEILQHGINIGLVQPGFDMEIFARILTGSLMAMGIEAFADPNYSVGLLDHEVRVREMLVRLFRTALL